MTKYIFDFDDVLFYNTEKFKKHMYQCFEKVGVPNEVVKKYYTKERDKGFILRNLVDSVLQGEEIRSISTNDLTEMIMSECKNLINHELTARIRQIGADSCYLVTHGVTEYQREKINRTGLTPLFTQICIVQDTKKGSVEMICEQFVNEEVVFVDDKEKRFVDLDYEKHPNLRTVLYIGLESIPEIFK